MANAKILVIQETEKEIKSLLKQAIPFIGQRLRVLLILKQNEKTGISKREVATLSGVDPNSVQNWRTLYVKSGIEDLLTHKKLDLNLRFLILLNIICYKKNSLTLRMDFRVM